MSEGTTFGSYRGITEVIPYVSGRVTPGRCTGEKSVRGLSGTRGDETRRVTKVNLGKEFCIWIVVEKHRKGMVQ